MRIVNREEFLKLPAGTLYAKYQSLGCWGALEIKEESTDFNDWYQYNLLNGWAGCGSSDQFYDKVMLAEKGEAQLSNDFDCSGRDGLFDDDQLFIVYDKWDIEQLIKKLQELVTKQH